MFKRALLLLLLPAPLLAQLPKDGPVKYYYPNGNVSSEGTLRNGKPDGYWKSYSERGRIKSEGNRVDFKLDSSWRFTTTAASSPPSTITKKDLRTACNAPTGTTVSCKASTPIR